MMQPDLTSDPTSEVENRLNLGKRSVLALTKDWLPNPEVLHKSVSFDIKAFSDACPAEALGEGGWWQWKH